MATKAFILIETSVGKTKEVANTLRSVTEIASVDVVTGPYDIIAVMEAPDIAAMGDLITANVHADGVIRTVTCISVGS